MQEWFRKNLVLVGVGIAVVAVAALVLPGVIAPDAHADGLSANAYTTPPAASNVCSGKLVAATSTIITSNDTWAVGAMFCNDSTNMIYLSIGSAAVLHQGILVPAGTCTVLPYPTTDYVNAIADVTNGTYCTWCLGKK